MEVILLEKIANLGSLGDKVSVKPGFARNYLIPKSLAKPATKANIAEFEARRHELENLEGNKIKAAQEQAQKLEGKVVTIKHLAGEEGKLFGSVTAHEITEAITADLMKIEKKQIRMSEGPIRAIGEQIVQVVLHPDVIAEVTVKVEATAG